MAQGIKLLSRHGETLGDGKSSLFIGKEQLTWLSSEDPHCSVPQMG